MIPDPRGYNPWNPNARKAECKFCGRPQFQMPEGVCGFCLESPEYIDAMEFRREVELRNKRTERINAIYKEHK